MQPEPVSNVNHFHHLHVLWKKNPHIAVVSKFYSDRFSWIYFLPSNNTKNYSGSVWLRNCVLLIVFMCIIYCIIVLFIMLFIVYLCIVLDAPINVPQCCVVKFSGKYWLHFTGIGNKVKR